MKKFFKRFAAIIGIVALVGGAFVGCQKEATKDSEAKNEQAVTKETEGELQKVKLNEVVRSVFYAPMYVAINEGFFEEEGLEIDLSTGQGADTTISKLQQY